MKKHLSKIFLTFFVLSPLLSWAQCEVEISATETEICFGESTVLSATTLPGVLSTFAAGNGQDGNMFDIVAKNDIIITQFDGHPQNSATFEIYYKVGSHVGSETTPEDWTLIGTAQAGFNGSGVPTPIPIPINLELEQDQTYGFYVTTLSEQVSYTNGTGLGNVYAENDDLQILEGRGKSYPFGATYSPRIWNGIVHYEYASTSFSWSNGATTPVIEVFPEETTEFNVEVNTGACLASDAININVSEGLTLDIEDLPELIFNCGIGIITQLPTASSECLGTVFGTTSDPLEYNEAGTYSINWQYDGGNGNIIEQVQVLKLNEDQLAPEPNLATLEDIVSECEVELNSPTAHDACAGTVNGSTSDPTEFSTPGTYFVNWIYTDDFENTASQIQKVIIIGDITAPTPNNPSLDEITSSCPIYINSRPRRAKAIEVAIGEGVPTATDNCQGLIYGTTSDPLEYFETGTFIITWTYDDGNGNISEQEQVINKLEDETPPEPYESVLESIVSSCPIIIEETPMAYDDCTGEVYGTTSDPLEYYDQGSFTITWSYEDDKGNITEQQQEVNFTGDVTAPIPYEESLPTIVADCFIEIEEIPLAIDECQGDIIGTTGDPLFYNIAGTYAITWIYRDDYGNETPQIQQVIIEIDAPVPDQSELSYIYDECAVEIEEIPTATSYCSGTIIATTEDPLFYNEPGDYIITWVYDDNQGNLVEQLQYVEIDNLLPEPYDVELETIYADCSVTVSEVPMAEDECLGTINGTTTDPLSYSSQGEYIITWTYTNGHGSTLTQLQYVIVEDTSDPVPSLLSLPDINGECSAVINITPTAIDNCAGTITATTSDPRSYNTEGSYVINWIFDDGNGNEISQTQNVIINEDSTDPIPDEITLVDLNSACTVSISTPPTATDNCAGTITATTGDPLFYDTEGSYVINWSYDDNNGNVVLQTQNVIIGADNTPPVPDLASLVTISGQCLVTISTIPTATDDCAGVISATTSDPLSYGDEGSYTITWNYDDGDGNMVSQDQTIIIQADATAPVPNISTLQAVSGECSVEITDIPTALDACRGNIVATTSDPLLYEEIGSYSITWTYDDGIGNTITQAQAVTVASDQTGPVPNVSALPVISGDCSATVTSVPSSTDACEGTFEGSTSDPLTYDVPGTYTVTWTYTDDAGNNTNQTQTVVVKDTKAPVPSLSSLPDVLGECSVEISTAPTATDNCQGSIVGTTTDPLSYSEQGVFEVTWIYDDGNGNTSEQVQEVTVLDKTAPVADLVSLETITGDCSVEVTSIPTATDACTGAINGTTDDPLTYDVAGNYTIIWQYDDGLGNSSEQAQTVIVSDNVAPTATCPESIVTCDGVITSIGLTDVTDNCGIAGISYVLSGATSGSGEDDASGEIFRNGVTTVTYTIEDINGNTSTCDFTVTHETTEEVTLTNTDGELSTDSEGTYQWINCADNSVIAGANENTFTPTESGEYAVVVSNDECSNTSDCSSVEIILNAESTSLANKFKVYPNPVNGFASISSGSINTNVTIRIVNISGQTVLTKKIETMEKVSFDFSNLTEGVYLININSDQQNSVMRVIKK